MNTLLLLPVLAAAGAYVPERMTLLTRVMEILAIAAVVVAALVLQFSFYTFVPIPSEEERANWR